MPPSVLATKTTASTPRRLFPTLVGYSWAHYRADAIAAEPINHIDTIAAQMLRELKDWLQQQKITLYFAEMKGQTKDGLHRYGLFQNP